MALIQNTSSDWHRRRQQLVQKLRFKTRRFRSFIDAYRTIYLFLYNRVYDTNEHIPSLEEKLQLPASPSQYAGRPDEDMPVAIAANGTP
jgi:hypothetical protein